MTTRQFLIGLLAVVAAPWKALSKTQPKMVKLGERVYPNRYDDFTGLIGMDTRRPDDFWIVLRKANNGEVWQGQSLNNDRQNKYWGQHISTGKRSLLCIDFPEYIHFYKGNVTIVS